MRNVRCFEAFVFKGCGLAFVLVVAHRYIGYNKNLTAKWPYLEGLEAPQWDDTTQNWFQMFFLYVTLLSNFVPLSMYVTVEMVNFFFLWLVYVDLEMYDAKTDTRAVARSTNVTDLGQVEYIFSDKTGTLTQGKFKVTELQCLNNANRAETLELLGFPPDADLWCDTTDASASFNDCKST